MSSTACLVTSTPEFTPPEQTRPFLIASSADPDPRNVLLTNTVGLIEKPQNFKFTADVVSEDQGSQVEGWLLVDYGKRPAAGTISSSTTKELIPIGSGTMADTEARNIGGVLTPWELRGDLGCHTVTLMVSHAFVRGLHCPRCRNDSSQITWHYQVCDPQSTDGNCDTSAANCQKFDESCPADGDPNDGVSCGAAPQ